MAEERDYSGAAWNALMEEETKESIARLYLDSMRGFTVRGAQKEYKIERLWENGAEYIAVDGVRCTPEALESLIVSPRPDCWFRFERKDDMVTIHQLQPGEPVYYGAPKAFPLDLE